MAAELNDLRAKITDEAHCALAAHVRAHGIEKSELVRDIRHAWAMKQIHGATILQSCLKAKGVTVAPQGTSGNALDWDGE